MIKEKDIEDKIIDFCYDIIQNPLIYFSEADLQQLLTEKLRTIPALKDLYNTNIAAGYGADGKRSKKNYLTSAMHREYAGGDNTRIDIVILNRKDISRINRIKSLKINSEYVDIDFGFELGTEKTDINKTIQHLEKDIEKLIQCCREKGYIIHFYRDSAISGKYTKTREKTDKNIELKFKKVFEEAIHNDKKFDSYRQNKNKIKIISVLLSVSRRNETIKGKCKIYNNRKKKFEAVNINSESKISNAIKNNLN